MQENLDQCSSRAASTGGSTNHDKEVREERCKHLHTKGSVFKKISKESPSFGMNIEMAPVFG